MENQLNQQKQDTKNNASGQSKRKISILLVFVLILLVINIILPLILLISTVNGLFHEHGSKQERLRWEAEHGYGDYEKLREELGLSTFSLRNKVGLASSLIMLTFSIGLIFLLKRNRERFARLVLIFNFVIIFINFVLNGLYIITTSHGYNLFKFCC